MMIDQNIIADHKINLAKACRELAESPGLIAVNEQRARQILLFGHDAKADSAKSLTQLVRKAQAELIHCHEDIDRGTAMLRHAQRKAAIAAALAIAAYDRLETEIKDRAEGGIQEELFNEKE